MTRGFGKFGIVAIAAGGLILLAGCKVEPKATEAELTVADVQGVSFNDPLPAADAATTDSSTEPGAAAPVVAEAESPDVTKPLPHATAETMPTNIAAIPSATPMPSPTPDPVIEEPVEVAQIDAGGDYVPVSFKKLSSFNYVEPIPGQAQEGAAEPEKADQIPSEIKALDGKKAIVEGWMVPMEVAEDGSVKSFVLVKTQPQCCFGDMQAMNEWVDVTMLPGKNAEFNVDLPMKVYGQLDVGEKMEDGFVLSVYRMKAEKVEL